jgi:hypothetical protein
MRTPGILLTMVIGVGACSSESTFATPDAGNAEPKADAAGREDAGRDSGKDSAIIAVSNEDGTIGRSCSTKADCELAGDDDKLCSNALTVKGSYSPSPFCIGTCDITDLTMLESCDGDRGICLGSTVGKAKGSCRPRCTFLETGVTLGCIGKNACRYEAVNKNSAGKTVGTGYCVSACRADADCPTDEACSFGSCLKKVNVTPKTKTLGQACENTGGTPECACFYNGSGPSLGKGYCTDFCVTGESCGAGFLCSARLRGPQDANYPFVTQPNGLAGYCMKTCVTSAECTELSSTCQEFAGGKVCKPLEP